MTDNKLSQNKPSQKATGSLNPPLASSESGAASGRASFQQGLERLIRTSTNAELIDLISLAADELKQRQGTLTSALASGRIPDIPLARETLPPRHFVRVRPLPAPTTGEPDTSRVWRLVLTSPDPKHGPLGIEIGRDAIIGRDSGDFHPDIDLTDYDATQYGVSRRHALLRPTRQALLIADLGSTNGTSYNLEKLTLGTAPVLKTDDIISFANLHMRVKIVSRPDK